MDFAQSPLRNPLQTFFSSVAQLIWPTGCLGCNATLTTHFAFCSLCEQTLLTLDPNTSCSRCAGPLTEDESSSKTKLFCRNCNLINPVFHTLTASYQYGGAVVLALQKLKWGSRDDMAKPLGQCMAPTLAKKLASVDAVVPVPLHTSRLYKRGYNQAALLAHHAMAACHEKKPLHPNWLQRIRPASENRHKSAPERISDTQLAFVVPPRAEAALLEKKILLVDDVVTTGATAQACAQALLSAGAAQVDVVALCRAIF